MHYGLRRQLRLYGKEGMVMNKPLYNKPVPAIAIAIGMGIAAHKANANAAAALGVPALAISLLVGLLLAFFGLPGLGT